MEDVKTVPMENMNTSAKVQSVNSAAVPAMEEDVKTALARNIVMGMAVINADGAVAKATAEDVKTAQQETRTLIITHLVTPTKPLPNFRRGKSFREYFPKLLQDT